MAIDIYLTPEQEAALETTSPKRLRQLARQSDRLARIVANNHNTPVSSLKIFAQDRDRSVRCYAADNSKISVDILGILVIDRAIDVRSYATKNLSRQKA